MNLTFQEFGSKSNPTLVFLHGIGVSSWMWEAQIDDLQHDYHCITIDLPGNGQSYQVEWKSFEDSAAQVAQIIENHAKGGNADVIGLSLGGYVAIYLLQLYPQRVRSMIVSGVSTRPFTQKWLWRGVMSVMPTLTKWDPFIKMSANMMQFPPEVLPLYIRDSKRVSRLTYSRVYSTVFDFTLPAELAQRPHRVLAVVGDGEVGMIKEGLADFPALLPNATTRLIPNAHHGWNGEHPQLFTEMLRAWVQDQPLPAPLDPAPETVQAREPILER